MVGGPSHWETVGPDTCIVCGLAVSAHLRPAPAAVPTTPNFAPYVAKDTEREKAATPTAAVHIHTS
jgi:hypothetical protein